MKRSGWVTARANCSAVDSFNLIIKQVKDDVAEYNRLPKHKTGRHAFRTKFAEGELVVRRVELVTDHRGTHDVEEVDCTNVVVIRWADDDIVAFRAGVLHLTITPQWNAERQECDFQVEDATWPLPRISEHILGDFLFREWGRS